MASLGQPCYTANPLKTETQDATNDSSSRLEGISQVVLSLLSLAIVIVGTVGNLVTCLLVYRKPSMHSAINLLLANGAFADGILAFLCVPLNLLSLFTGERVIGNGVCQAHAFIHTLCLTETAAMLLIIGVDRYQIIVRRRDRLSVMRARALIGGSWLAAIVVGLPGVLMKPGYDYYPGMTQCELAKVQTVGDGVYLAIHFAAIFGICCIVVAFAFARVIVAVRHNAARISAYPYTPTSIFTISNPNSNGSSKLTTTSARRWRNKISAERYAIAASPTATSPDSRQRHPQHHTVDLRFKTRTFTTVLILFIVFLICRTPYSIALLVLNAAGIVSPPAHTFLLWWSFLNPALNPIIYTWRIRKFREACREWLPMACVRCLPVLLRTDDHKLQHPSFTYQLNRSYQCMQTNQGVI